MNTYEVAPGHFMSVDEDFGDNITAKDLAYIKANGQDANQDGTPKPSTYQINPGQYVTTNKDYGDPENSAVMNQIMSAGQPTNADGSTITNPNFAKQMQQQMINTNANNAWQGVKSIGKEMLPTFLATAATAAAPEFAPEWWGQILNPAIRAGANGLAGGLAAGGTTAVQDALSNGKLQLSNSQFDNAVKNAWNTFKWTGAGSLAGEGLGKLMGAPLKAITNPTEPPISNPLSNPLSNPPVANSSTLPQISSILDAQGNPFSKAPTTPITPRTLSPLELSMTNKLLNMQDIGNYSKTYRQFGKYVGTGTNLIQNQIQNVIPQVQSAANSAHAAVVPELQKVLQSIMGVPQTTQTTAQTTAQTKQ